MTSGESTQGQQSRIRALLVEDSQQDADFVGMMLKRSLEVKVEINHVRSLSEAVAECHVGNHDIILLDLGLPDSSGTESVQRLRSCAPLTPVVVLTGDDRDDTAIAAINAGAQDYMPKQHVVGQLLTRMMKHSIARHHRLLRAQSEALEDGLTGLPNRRACDEELVRRLADFRRHGYPVCVAVYDIDLFKQINDSWGHEVGDQVICAVADVLRQNCRKSDLVARYGGEEFVMILPMTPFRGARIVVERTHHAVGELIVTDHQLSVTVSAGLAEVTKQDDARSLFSRADKAMYGAKRGGRNRWMQHVGGHVMEGSLDGRLRPTTIES